ncbi:hypothetical protein MEO93_26480 [Dolichospermum sp. ST_sed3]|nr:hypothetical protein [Dolichospermum sp. ST_sed3]
MKGITYLNRPARNINLLPDSIRIEFPDQKALVIFEMNNVTKNSGVIEHFGDSLKGWLQAIRRSSSDLESPKRAEITIKENGEKKIIIYVAPDVKTYLTVKENAVTELLPPGWEISVRAKDYKTYVYAQEFSALVQVANQNFTLAVEKIKEDIRMNPLRRKTLKSRIILKEDKVQYSEMKRKIASDFIVGTASAGLGYLGDKFYPELNLNVTLRFGGRFDPNNNKVTFSYNNLFLAEKSTDGSYNTHINSFISVAWNKNLNYRHEHPLWIGIGAGYLIQNRGDYFKGNTFKFFISKDVGNVSITPELYMTDDFKKSLLGIKFNYTF